MDRERGMEEKPEAVMNVVVVNNNHIPHDIVFSILSKLPPKSLKRFGCVCKSWSHLFENPYFVSMYNNNFAHTSLLLKLDAPHSLMYLLSGERFETRVRLDSPFGAFHRCQHREDLGPLGFHIMNSSNGILCLNYLHNSFVLWNPSTREFKVIPPSLVEFESPFRQPTIYYKGFGYDHVTDDYKVIRYVQFEESTFGPSMINVSLEPLWEIYSLRSDSWKTLDCKMHTNSWGGDLYTDSHVYNKGVCHCHWLDQIYLVDDKVLLSCLVSFDLSNEVFFKTPMPSYMGASSFSCRPTKMQLGVINRCVALISKCPEKTTIEVSILREVGVKESWTKLFIIGPLPCVWNLMGVWKNGHIFIQNEDDELAWFECSTHGIARIVDLGLKLPICQIVTYKENFESLISLGFEKYD